MKLLYLPTGRQLFFVRTIGAAGLFVLFYYYFFHVKTSYYPVQQADDAYIVPICIFGIILLFGSYRLWWIFAGKEIITVGDGVLTVEKKNSITKPVSYDLHAATNFRSVEEVVVNDRGRQFYNGYPWQVALKGTVKFDYGVDTIQFGDMLTQAEGEYILERLRAKKLIS